MTVENQVEINKKSTILMLPQVSQYKILFKKRQSRGNIFQSTVPITCSMHIWITLIILIIFGI